MKKLRNLSKRGLALFLSLVMCLSLLQVTALAADVTRITVGKDDLNDPNAIVGALDTEFPKNALETDGWYYKISDGSNVSGTYTYTHKEYWIFGNDVTETKAMDWPDRLPLYVPVEGGAFERDLSTQIGSYTVGGIFRATASPMYPCVLGQEYTVARNALGATNHVVTFVNDSEIVEKSANSVYSVDLIVNPNTEAVDEAAVKAAILNAVVDSTVPANASVTVTGTFEAGEQNITLSLPETNTHNACSITVKVNFVAGKEDAPIEVQDATVSLIYKEVGGTVVVDEVATAAAVKTAVVTEVQLPVTFDAVTVSDITYAEGTHTANVYWEGDGDYNEFNQQVSVTLEDNRTAVNFPTDFVWTKTINVSGTNPYIVENEANAIRNEVATALNVNAADVTVTGLPETPDYNAPAMVTIKVAETTERKPYESSTYTVSFVDARPTLSLTANGTVTVDAACNAGNVKQQIADALGKELSDGTTPVVVNASDLEMTYTATLSTGDVVMDQLIAQYIKTGLTEKVSIENGKDLDRVSEFAISAGLKIMQAALKLPDSMINQIKANMRYPAIGAGTHEVTVTYTGADYKYDGKSATVTVEIGKAPAKVTVPALTTVRKGTDYASPVRVDCGVCNGEEIGKISVYAGIDIDGNFQVYLDLSQLNAPYVEYVVQSAIEKGGSIQGIIDEIKSKLPGIELPDIGGDLGDKIGDAIWEAIEKAISGGLEQGGASGLTQPVLNVLNKIKDAIGSNANIGNALDKVTEAIKNAGSQIKFAAGKPTEAGVYGVTGIALDANHTQNGLPGAGLLVITLDTIKVTVHSTSIKVGEEIPDNFITTDPKVDTVCAIYAGLPTGVWLDVPDDYKFDGVTNVGELSAALNEAADKATDAVGLNYNVINKLLEVITSLDMPGVIDSVPVQYGAPTNVAGVYTVTAIASDRGNAIPGVGFGTLTVGLNKDVTVTVGNATLIVGQDTEVPDLVTVDPEGTRYLVLYAGVNGGSGKLTGELYLEGLSGVENGTTMTVGELRQRFAGNELLDDYQLISALLEKLPETAVDSWTVTTGRPPVAVGAYTVVAGAVRAGSMPAVDVGSLTIIDKEMYVVAYVAADNNGTVQLTNQSVGGPVVFEAVPSTSNPVGAKAVAKDTHHFVEWTRVGFPSFNDKNNPLIPSRPTGLLDMIPDWITSRLPGFDRIPDLGKVAAIYVAHFDEHDWEELSNTVDICGGGKITYKCGVCGATKEVVVAGDGHDWDEWTKLNENEHQRVCKRDNSHTETEAHNWDPGAVTTPATCTTEGVRTITCRDCGATKTEVISKSEHCVATSSITKGTAPTCTENGTPDHWECVVCGGWFSDPACTIELTGEAKVIPATGHKWDAGTQMSSSCEGAGVMRYECTVCHTTKDVEEIPATGHDWDMENGVVIEVPTCGNAKVTQYTCKKCGATKLVAASALGHDMQSVDAKAATCTESGHTAYDQCTRCKATIGMELIPAKGHSYSEVVTAPTCTEQGYTTHVCANDPEHDYVDTYVSASGHTEGAGVVTTQPTATTPGVRTYYCTVCGDVTRTEPIPATGETPEEHVHSYTAVVTAPTHTAQGYTTYTCSCGNSYVSDYVPAVGHTYTSEITVYPTAYTTGLRTYTCSCGATYTEVIPATGGGTTSPTFPAPGGTTGGNTGGTGGTTINDNNVPLTNGEDIIDDDVPLAGAVGLNSSDHYAYIKGYDDGTVRPTNYITRAEVATVFFRLMTELYRITNWSTTNSFTDTNPDAWYNNAVSTATNAGLLKGYEDGRFLPEDNITRAEFVSIAVRFLGADVTGDDVEDFADTADKWFSTAVRRAVEAGWLVVEGDMFRPDEYITRADVMSIINRMLNRVPNVDGMLPEMKTWSDNPVTAWYYGDVQEATNGHLHTFDEEGNKETWTELTADKDWAALEAEWAANDGASASNEG